METFYAIVLQAPLPWRRANLSYQAV